MPEDANKIVSAAEEEREGVQDNVRDAAEWFHDHEGEMFEREEARSTLADELDVDVKTAQKIIAELVGDIVDPVVQLVADNTKYVGIVEYHEFEGAYGYLDHHDILGSRKRVVCAQCVHESSIDTEVAHATAGDPGAHSAMMLTMMTFLTGFTNIIRPLTMKFQKM